MMSFLWFSFWVVIKMTTMVIPKFMANIVETLGQDIYFDKFTGYLIKYCIHGYFSGGYRHIYWYNGGLYLWSIRTANVSFHFLIRGHLFSLTIFQVVIKMTIDVMVVYDLWSIRTNNIHMIPQFEATVNKNNKD